MTCDYGAFLSSADTGNPHCVYDEYDELIDCEYTSTCTNACSCTPIILACTPVSPTAPTLTSPANGVHVTGTPQILQWNTTNFGTKCPAPNTNSYDVYFGLAGSLSLRGNTTSTSMSVTVSPGNTYQWYVQAKNGEATQTVTWSFTVTRNGTIEG
jgi:hypothetical protein